jgi:hypothetical protein
MWGGIDPKDAVAYGVTSLHGVGYGAYSDYNNNTPQGSLNDAALDSVWVAAGHGGPGQIAVEYGATGTDPGLNGAVGVGAVYSGNEFNLSPAFKLGQNACLGCQTYGSYSGMKLMVFFGCQTGANVQGIGSTYDYGNLLLEATGHTGAKAAMGFTNDIDYPQALTYSDYFWPDLASGYTVTAAANDAANWVWADWWWASPLSRGDDWGFDSVNIVGSATIKIVPAGYAS